MKHIKITEIQPLNDTILVTDMNFEERISAGGIVLLSDNGKTQGIRPRWGKVYAVGPTQTDVEIGDWVCVEHGRWTRGITIEDETGVKKLHKIENSAILCTSKEEVIDDSMTKVNH